MSRTYRKHAAENKQKDRHRRHNDSLKSNKQRRPRQRTKLRKEYL